MATKGSDSPISSEIISLQQQNYYHGILPRSATNQLLLLPGDFLVRSSTNSDNSLRIIISTLHTDGRILHFPVNKTEKGYLLQDQPFNNVVKLIQHYWRRKLPLTQETGALLIRPVQRTSWQLQLQNIKLDREIGSGNSATVFSGWLRTADRKWRPAAIKKPNYSTISNKQGENFIAEAKILLQLNHSNVVQFYGVCAESHPMLIVMELCTGGSLLKKLKSKVGMDMKLSYCYDVAVGMKYLHSKNIIHRDLAARNCLLNDSGKVKISDFGLSKEGNYQLAAGMQRTLPLRWLAPESILNGKYTTKSDVYMFAVLLWEIFSDGKHPWASLKTGKHVIQVVKQGQRLYFPECTPRLVRELAMKSFRNNPSERPTFEDIFKVFSDLKT